MAKLNMFSQQSLIGLVNRHSHTRFNVVMHIFPEIAIDFPLYFHSTIPKIADFKYIPSELSMANVAGEFTKTIKKLNVPGL